MMFLLTVDDDRFLLPELQSNKTIFSEEENSFLSIFILIKSNIFYLEQNMVSEIFPLSSEILLGRGDSFSNSFSVMSSL